MPYPRQADTCNMCPTPMPRKANGRRPRCPDCRRKVKLLVKYGISPKQYNQMLLEQGGLCKICRRPETRVIRGMLMPLPVDHDHDTGEVRGLLCYDCNIMIGHAHDSPETLRAAAAYLEDAAMRTGTIPKAKKTTTKKD